MKHLVFTFLALSLWCASAQTPANSTPGQVAITYYQLCGKVPLDLNAINNLRSTKAREADRRLSRGALEARSGVLSAVGGYGTLLAARVVNERISGDNATVSALLTYRVMNPRKLDITLVKEDGAWKVAD